MNDCEIIEDDEAIIMKCPTCGKFRDAIAFAPQLPTRLAPDGFVRCACSQTPPTSPGLVSDDVFADVMQYLDGIRNDMSIFVNRRMMHRLRQAWAHSDRLQCRKKIERRQKRADFRRRKRGLV